MLNNKFLKVTKMVIASLSGDDKKVYPVDGINSVKTAPTYQEVKIEGNGDVQEDYLKIMNYSLTAKMNNFPHELAAQVLGMTKMANGVLKQEGKKMSNFYVAYRIETTEGIGVYFIFMNCSSFKVSDLGVTNPASNATSVSGTDKELHCTANKDANGVICYIASEEDVNITADIFDTVPTEETLSQLTKVTGTTKVEKV